MSNSVQQITTDLLQRQPIGHIFLSADTAVRLPWQDIGVAISACYWRIIGCLHNDTYATSACWKAGGHDRRAFAGLKQLLASCRLARPWRILPGPMTPRERIGFKIPGGKKS
jgi:hypothetical protein